jgi:hypothetical protein
MKPKSGIKINSQMKVTMMLADHAEAINGKLYIMGGGWSLTGPHPCQSALAIKIEVPWNDTNHRHELKVELLDGDFHPVMVPTPAGNSPLVINASFEVGRPAGILVGSPLDVPFAVNIAPIQIEPGRRYVWKLTIDGKSDDSWQVTFATRATGQIPPLRPSV